MINAPQNLRRADAFAALSFATALVVPFLASTSALADVPCGTETCPTGFVCESYESTGCAKPAEPVADTTTENCATSVSYACTRAPCTKDADCGAAMVCYTSTVSECTGTATPAIACDPAAPDCKATPTLAAQSACTTKTEQRCAYRFELPCTAAADCGAGFTCEEGMSCGCSGSAGSASTTVAVEADSTNVTTGSSGVSRSETSGSGGATGVGAPGVAAAEPASSESNCSCEPTGTFACKLQTITCTSDSACPSGLVCGAANPSSCAVSSDGTSSCTAAEPTKTCQLPYQRLGLDGAKSDYASAEGSTTTSGAMDEDTATSNAAPETSSGPSAADNSSAASEQSNADQTNVGGGGCSVSASAQVHDAGIFSLMLGLGLALLRRSRRSAT